MIHSHNDHISGAFCVPSILHALSHLIPTVVTIACLLNTHPVDLKGLDSNPTSASSLDDLEQVT